MRAEKGLIRWIYKMGDGATKGPAVIQIDNCFCRGRHVPARDQLQKILISLAKIKQSGKVREKFLSIVNNKINRFFFDLAREIASSISTN